MTHSSDPKAPKSSRKKPSREPATIDLKATVLDDGAQQDKAWDNVKPEETIVPETDAPAENTIGAPEATLDSGMNADSVEASTAADELPPSPAPERHASPAALIGSSLLGGLVGAGLVYGLQFWQQTPSTQEDQRLAQLEQRVNALESTQDSLDQRFQDIQNAANRALARAEEAFNRPPSPAPQSEGAINDLSNRLSALESEVRTSAQNAAQGLDRRMAEQDQRLAALSQQVAQNSRNVEATGQTGTRVVLTERLGDALRNGAPFSDVLEGLRKTGANSEQLKPLEPFAEKGAPTASAMLARFEPLEAQILRDERAASGEWSDRLLRMLDKVVTVRSVNEQGNTGIPATVARIRQALAWGDMGGAAAAWASLPEPARRISEEWGRQITALAGAQQASRDLASEALAALNRSMQ